MSALETVKAMAANDIVIIPRAKYDALMAAAKALQDFWGFTQARGGEYHVVARQTMDALDALCAAGVDINVSVSDPGVQTRD